MTRDYPERPISGIGAVIIEGGKVLLIRRGRAPGKGAWSLPGGAQKLGETAEEALVREVREETGLDVKPKRLIAVVDIIERDREGKVAHHYTVADYAVEVSSGAVKAGGDAASARWFSRHELDTLNLTPKMREVIKAAWTRCASASAARKLKRHLAVFGLALLFGLAAYAAILLLIMLFPER